MAIQHNITTINSTQALTELGETIARQRRELAVSMRQHRKEQQRLRKAVRDHLDMYLATIPNRPQ